MAAGSRPSLLPSALSHMAAWVSTGWDAHLPVSEKWRARGCDGRMERAAGPRASVFGADSVDQLGRHLCTGSQFNKRCALPLILDSSL